MAGHKPGRPFRFDADWVAVVVEWVTTKMPRDFGFLRSRWCCEAVAILMLEPISSTSAARRSAAGSIAATWSIAARAPSSGRPTNSGRPSSTHSAHCWPSLPADETVVWQDEVDINTNPEIGRMWMRQRAAGHGHHARGPTRSGTSPARSTGGPGRSSPPREPKRDEKLFLAHLDDLRSSAEAVSQDPRDLRLASSTPAREAAEYLGKHRDRIELEMLPAYSPDANPMERVWWHLREHVTRNHRCQTMEELLDLTFAWLEPQSVQGRGLGLQREGRRFGTARSWTRLFGLRGKAEIEDAIKKALDTKLREAASVLSVRRERTCSEVMAHWAGRRSTIPLGMFASPHKE